MPNRNLVALLVMTAAVLSLFGCVSGRSPSARFFQLQPAPDIKTAEGTPLNAGCAVVLRPVTLEPYLNRPQMVSRVNPYEIGYNEFARWAEPLDKNVTRVLTENLRHLLQTDRVVIFPQTAPKTKNASVSVDISRFEAKPGGKAELNAAWTVRMEADGKIVNRAKDFSVSVAGNRIEDAAAAQAGLLADLSKLIAADVLALATATPAPAAESATP
jgi:uncharacterized lipoprotein YmbA